MGESSDRLVGSIPEAVKWKEIILRLYTAESGLGGEWMPLIE